MKRGQRLDPVARRLVAWFLDAPATPVDVEARAKWGVFQGTVSIVGNILLAAIKLVLGLMTNSIALLADAFHTASDVLTSIVVVVGFKMMKKPADIEHPYGHGRIEPIATLIISLLLIWVGIEFAHASYDRLRAPPRIQWSALALVIMSFSVVMKEWMARFSLSIGRIVQSDMLKADAWHHRSDALASALVVISLSAAALGYPSIDSLFGFCVAGLIIYTGVDLLRSMVSVLMGKAPTRDLVDGVVRAGLSVEGVRGIHDIQVHDYGHQKLISLHVVIPGEVETARSHDLAKRVEDAIGESLHASAVVHVDPSQDGPYPTQEAVDQVLRHIVREYAEIKRFENLAISMFEGRPLIEFRLIMDRTLSLEKAHHIGHRIVTRLKEWMGECKIKPDIEPEHTPHEPTQ